MNCTPSFAHCAVCVVPLLARPYHSTSDIGHITQVTTDIYDDVEQQNSTLDQTVSFALLPICADASFASAKCICILRCIYRAIIATCWKSVWYWPWGRQAVADYWILRLSFYRDLDSLETVLVVVAEPIVAVSDLVVIQW